MIQKYQRNIGQNYFNILEKFVALCVNEYYDILTTFGYYLVDKEDELEGRYNIRKIFWTLVLFGFGLIMLFPFYFSIAIYTISALR